MAPAATSQINAAAVQNHFGNAFPSSPDLPTIHFLVTYGGGAGFQCTYHQVNKQICMVGSKLV